MAAAPLHRLTPRGAARRLLHIALAVLAMLGALAIGFPLAAWIGSSIPETAPQPLPPAADTLDIMVETNGVHTSIIMPIVTPEKDWRTSFPSAARPLANGFMPTHIAVGWGEREVFLSVPTWGDLRPGTALRILTVGGDALIRVSHYLRPAPSVNHRPVRITRAQYARLVAAIERALPELPPGQTREVLQGTYTHDAYYEARGVYTMANTCNTWVGDRLAESGVPMGRWTPFAGGVMKWIPLPEPGA